MLLLRIKASKPMISGDECRLARNSFPVWTPATVLSFLTTILNSPFRTREFHLLHCIASFGNCYLESVLFIGTVRECDAIDEAKVFLEDRTPTNCKRPRVLLSSSAGIF